MEHACLCCLSLDVLCVSAPDGNFCGLFYILENVSYRDRGRIDAFYVRVQVCVCVCVCLCVRVCVCMRGMFYISKILS